MCSLLAFIESIGSWTVRFELKSMHILIFPSFPGRNNVILDGYHIYQILQKIYYCPWKLSLMNRYLEEMIYCVYLYCYCDNSLASPTWNETRAWVLPISNWLFTNPNGPDLWSWHGARSRLLTPGFSSDNLVFEPFLIRGKFWSPGHLCERRHQPPHRITTILFWRYIRRIFLTLSLQHYNLMF